MPLRNFHILLSGSRDSAVLRALPPMWPGLDSRSRCHIWVEFVVGSRLCSEGFSPGSPVFLPPQIPFLSGNSLVEVRADMLKKGTEISDSETEQTRENHDRDTWNYASIQG